MDGLKVTEQLIQAAEEVKREYLNAGDQEDYCDREYNDLTHALELFRFGGVEGYKLAKQMQDNRINRRAAKDLQEELKPLYDLMNKYHTFFRDLKQVHADIELTRGRQKNRRYTPRARTDLNEAFSESRLRE